MINWKNWKTYVFLLLPIATGYLASFACHIGKNAGSIIPARPPAWVFGVVWPILYVLLGLAWVTLRTKNSHIIDALMILNVIGLVLWIIVYGCSQSKRGGLYVLLLVFTVALMVFGYAWSQNIAAGLMVTPFLAWITFAMLLNYTEINITN